MLHFHSQSTYTHTHPPHTHSLSLSFTSYTVRNVSLQTIAITLPRHSVIATLTLSHLAFLAPSLLVVTEGDTTRAAVPVTLQVVAAALPVCRGLKTWTNKGHFLPATETKNKVCL